MRPLRPNEIAKTGDFFLLFDHECNPEWIQISNKPMPLKRKTLQQLDEENISLHYPLVVMRPTAQERRQKKQPAIYVPTQEQKKQIKKVQAFYNS